MKSKILRILGILLFLPIFTLSTETVLAESPAFQGEIPQRIELIVGKSKLVDSPIPIKRVSVGNPQIADVLVVSPKQIHLNGKAPGVTSVILGRVDGSTAFFDLEVRADISRLKQKLKEILPGEDIRINAAHDSIILSGEVSGASNMSTALSVAEPYAPKKVVNLMQVGGVQQVMLEVRIAEMSRSLIRRLGLNFSFINKQGDFTTTLLGSLTGIESIEKLTEEPFETTITDKINALFRFHRGGATWTYFIDALKETGLVKILAEPTLITLNGQEASFLAGGEIPIPVPQAGVGIGVITIEYRPYGVGLHFIPTVLSSEKISLKVSPEVSELDYLRGVNLAGYMVPGVTTRKVSTVIELADGQSFAIAGLLKEDVRQIISKLPFLGDIPILGALFRSSQFQKNESELVVIVTPHLVKPLELTTQTLPTDQYVEPDDFEFYLLGSMEGSKPPSKKGLDREEWGMEGKFGHISP